jgi:hypothetical protein
MFTETVQESHASLRRVSAQIMSLFILSILTLTMFAGKAHAQIVGNLEANVPFQFHAGDARLPAGTYLIHMLDNSELTVMEITSADGSTSALFEVQAAKTNSTPAQSELVFNKYGNRYFLARVFDVGNQNGSQVVESRYEKKVSQENKSAEQQHVSARHSAQ